MIAYDLRKDSDEDRGQCDECHEAKADFEIMVEARGGNASEALCSTCLRRAMEDIERDMGH